MRAAQSEVEAALAEVKRQQAAYDAKTEELKQKSETGGVVSRGRAKNELAQHLCEDPLPLRRSKITLEAAQKRAEKATNAAAEARSKADADAAEASSARSAAEESARQGTPFLFIGNGIRYSLVNCSFGCTRLCRERCTGSRKDPRCG